jgi:hypothetical protein
MRYAEGGGLTAQGRSRRELVRLQAAALRDIAKALTQDRGRPQ